MREVVTRQLTRRFAALLREHRSGAEEGALLQAYELGRRAIGTETLLDVVACAHDAALDAIAEAPADEAPGILDAVSTLLTEALGPFEMTHRGYREANSALRRLNESLEQQVAERTRALQETVQRLRRLDLDRRRLMSRAINAQEEERRRIAADIHDDPLQILAAVVMRLQGLRRHLEDPMGLSLLGKLETDTKDAMGRLRRMMFELRPRVLDRDGLGAAIRHALESLHEETGVSVGLDDRLESQPPSKVRAIAYRIAREALANVRKHAEAASVEVVLEERDGGLLGTVRDDGVGFTIDPNRHQTGHAGLIDMQERADLVDGWCRVDSSPGSGSVVEFWVPLGEHDEEEAG